MQQHSPRSTVSQHLWVALALTAIALTFFISVDYGNTYGMDEWVHIYRTCQTHSAEMVQRPFALSALLLVCPFLKTDIAAYHLMLIAFRAANAALLYLLVWRLSSQPMFAFATGAVFSTFLIRDSFFIFGLLQQNDNLFSQALVLLALNLFVVAYVKPVANSRLRIVLTIAGLLLAGFTTLVRETTFPLLIGIPVLLILINRDFSRPKLVGLALWVGVLLIAAIRLGYLLANSSSYTGGSFLDLDPIRMLYAAKNQLDVAFRRPLQITFAEIYQYRLFIVPVVGVLIVCFLALKHRLLSNRDLEPVGWRSLLRFSLWIGGGLAATLLGLAAFLPTVLATSPTRTHMLAILGESLMLTSLIWLISQLWQGAATRFVFQLFGVLWLAAHGVILANIGQAEFYDLKATWDNSAYFNRSLAHLVPVVKSPTLFIYIEHPENGETPYSTGFNFQYGMRYFYNDQVTGFIPTDNIFGTWTVSDNGILVTEEWIAHPTMFGWDRVIVFTREETERLRILDTLPEPFWTVDRQNRYHPYAQVEPSFIPERIRTTFPILSGPDWADINTLQR